MENGLLIALNSIVFLMSQFFHYQREAQTMKHLEHLVREIAASQEANGTSRATNICRRWSGGDTQHSNDCCYYY